MEELSSLGTVTKRSPVIDSAAMGAAQRMFANAVIELESELPPPELLRGLKQIEREFGRRRGQAWGDRVLDLDIVLWSGGIWHSRGLQIPHHGLAERRFVLDPAMLIADDWHVTSGGLKLRHLHARLTRSRPLPRDPLWSGR